MFEFEYGMLIANLRMYMAEYWWFEYFLIIALSAGLYFIHWLFYAMADDKLNRHF